MLYFIHRYSASAGQIMGSTSKWEQWGVVVCAEILLRMS